MLSAGNRKENVEDLIQKLAEGVGDTNGCMGRDSLYSGGQRKFLRERRENWEQIGTKNLLPQGNRGFSGCECPQAHSRLLCDLFNPDFLLPGV